MTEDGGSTKNAVRTKSFEGAHVYASMNFATKREFRRAVEAGEPIVLYSPAMGMPAINGTELVTGPWEPKTWHGVEHGWTARVKVQDMRVVAVLS